VSDSAKKRSVHAVSLYRRKCTASCVQRVLRRNSRWTEQCSRQCSRYNYRRLFGSSSATDQYLVPFPHGGRGPMTSRESYTGCHRLPIF